MDPHHVAGHVDRLTHAPVPSTAASRASRRSRRRRALAVVLVLGAAGGVRPAIVDADPLGLPENPPLSAANYWAFADRIMPALDEQWDARAGAYVSDSQGASSRTNANMLLIHAVAALRRHAGLTRQDARARRLIAHMIQRPMARLAHASNRTICWARRLDTGTLDHVSLDSQVAEALDAAWQAREALGLSRASAAAIVSTVDRCAHHPAWRFPHALSNQINWNAQLYAHAAHLTRRGDLLRNDYRRHLARFASAITHPLSGMVASNLGPGYGFHYSITRSSRAKLNFDTPEYANIVMSALQYYPQALHAGMAPLGAHSVRLLRGWVTRLLTGAWTHAGYLNWDTGYGRARWNSGQYWAFAQQGLLTIATTPQFWSHPEYGRWAKAMFDRGLLLYARWAAEAGSPRAPKLPFDVRSEHRDWDLYASRIAGNAVRAIMLGLGSRSAVDPPPLYDFDPETGRLAVTTPSYSTAIVPSNRGAFAYGGIDLARLYGAGQRVAANIGGVPPDSFGAIVKDAHGHRILASQQVDAGPRSLRVTRSPRGRISRAPSYPAKPLAGAFEHLEARGRARRGRVHIETAYDFRSRAIDARWTIACAPACARTTVDVDFPTWGHRAAITVVRRDATRIALTGSPARSRSGVALPVIDHVTLGRGRLGGYRLIRLTGPRGTRLHVVRTRPQATDPHPGHTLAFRLVASARLRTVRFAVRIVP